MKASKKSIRFLRDTSIGLAIAAVVSLLPSMPAQAQGKPVLKIGAVIASTGPASSLGIPEKNAVVLAEETLKGRSDLPFAVEFIIYDDGSDPTKSVNSVRKLISEDNVAVVICCTTTPASLAILETINSGAVLNISMAAAATVIEPAAQRKWTFKTPPTDRLMIERTLNHMNLAGHKKIAFFGLEDSYGEAGLVELQKLVGAKGIQLVTAERFARTDTNFTPQALRIRQAAPDAVYFHAIPPSAALAHQALVRVGFKGTIYHSAGAANAGFLSVGQDAVEGAIIGTAPIDVYAQLGSGNAVKASAAEVAKVFDAKHGPGKTDLFAAQGWDAAMLAVKALEGAVKNGAAPADLAGLRAKTRDSMEAIRDYKGAVGVFDFGPDNHLGLDNRATVLVTVKGGKFSLTAE